jgi:hypothetical protein
MSQDTIAAQVLVNRAALKAQAEEIERVCDQKYSNKVFTYT